MGENPPEKEEMKSILKLEADSERVKTLISQILRMGTRFFQLGGNGEPFFYKNVMEIIGILKAAGCYCSTNTNGTLLDRETVDELIKIEFDDLTITTMAGTHDVYERTHPGISKKVFSDMKQNLHYFAERKAALGVQHPKITLCFIVIRQNFDNVYSFAEFAAEVGAERVFYRPVDDVKEPGLKNLIPTQEQAALVKKQLEAVDSYLESRGISHNIRYFRKVFRQKLDTTALHRLIPCYYGWLAVMIDPDGTVYPCCRCYESLGNVYEKNFSDIWHGESYRKFRKESLGITQKKTTLSCCDCNNCVHHTANLRVFKKLHPLKAHSDQITELSPAILAESP
jgi:radical SAM protein with 4Fe4S-binding SPASM domain